MDGTVDGVIDHAFATSGPARGHVRQRHDRGRGSGLEHACWALAGNDTIIRGPGNDSIDGGFGQPTLICKDRPRPGEETVQRVGRATTAWGSSTSTRRCRISRSPYQGVRRHCRGAGSTSVLINVEFRHLRRGDPVAGLQRGARRCPGQPAGQFRRRDDRRPRRGGHDPGAERGADTILGGPGLDLIFRAAPAMTSCAGT